MELKFNSLFILGFLVFVFVLFFSFAKIQVACTCVSFGEFYFLASVALQIAKKRY